MVVTKAPSEPFAIVQATLLGMLAQDVPHNYMARRRGPFAGHARLVPPPRVKKVFVSTRRDRADYHCTSWPGAPACKEGNLAYFYDQYGLCAYDFVAQLDADHIPEPGYLWQMLRPFADP